MGGQGGGEFTCVGLCLLALIQHTLSERFFTEELQYRNPNSSIALKYKVSKKKSYFSDLIITDFCDIQMCTISVWTSRTSLILVAYWRSIKFYSENKLLNEYILLQICCHRNHKLLHIGTGWEKCCPLTSRCTSNWEISRKNINIVINVSMQEIHLLDTNIQWTHRHHLIMETY